MKSWPGTVVIALVLLIIIIAGANSDGDGRRGDDSAAASSSPTEPTGDESPESEGDEPDPPNTGAREAEGVALTFDDGPHPEYTPQILDILSENGVKAVFCVLGAQVERHPKLVQRMVDEGHVLCNHTFDHDAKLRERSDEQIIADMERTEEAIKEAVPNSVVSYFRQPMGYVSDNVAVVAASLDYRPLNWSIDTRDWEKPGAKAMVSTVEDELKAGSIIIMHDGGGNRDDTVAALPRIIDAIDDAGLPIVVPQRPFTAELVESQLAALW
jgi:peptidoglycan/xylan/chitin deacetylase (PgdA/CDA1 family)